MMRTSNPTLNDNVFRGDGRAVLAGDAMTVQGTVNKTGVLLLLVLLAAAYTWRMYFTAADSLGIWVMGGAIGGFIVALVTVFKKQWAAVTAPLYALLEGLVLGGISSLLEARYPGIVIQAVGLTFGTLFGLLFAYRSGLIKATENFKLGVVAATGGIALVYIATMVLGLFNIRMPYIHDSGLVGIGFSLVVVVIAALNLVLDFDFIEQGAAQGAPKYMEWYAAFGLMVTLIWLYIEILRLLSKMRSRR
jgi:uncharacterized YccA/Bax inhibitor family protein